MAAGVQIIGSYISPYVRKVLVMLHLKGIDYRIDPIVPFFGDERFSRLSPVRRIPVLIDDRVTLADSSVICQYLEDRYPSPMLYPRDVADRQQEESAVKRRRAAFRGWQACRRARRRRPAAGDGPDGGRGGTGSVGKGQTGRSLGVLPVGLGRQLG